MFLNPGTALMHHPLRTLAWLLVAGSTLLPQAAEAQTIRSPYEYVNEKNAITVFGGYLATDPGRVDLGPRSSPILGLRYAYRLTGPFNLEATASFAPTTRMVYDTTAANLPFERIGEVDMSLLLAELSLKFDVTGDRTYHNLLPYVLGGLGVVSDLSGDSPIEAPLSDAVRFNFGTRFAGHVGAGVEWFALRRLAIRGEVKDTFWRIPYPVAVQRQGGRDVPENEWVQNFAFTLGLTYRF